MNIKTLGQFAKAISGGSNNIPFPEYGGSGYGGYGGYGYGNNYISSPGSEYDWQTEAGVPWENGVVAACIAAIAEAFVDAPPILQEKAKGDWKLVPDAEPVELLLQPNNEYSAAALWGLTVLSDVSEGSAFWRLDWNKGKTSPQRIWYQENCEGGASRIYPMWSATEFISGYRLWVEGKVMDIDKDQIVYMRHMLNPRNTRLGWTPLHTVMRQIAGDNRVATFHSAILKNGVIPGQVWSPTGGGANQQAESVARNVTPEQAKAFKAALMRQYSGDGAGEPLVTDMPFEPHNSTYTPDQLALDKLGQYYALRICAALKVPAMIIGISEQSKTYSNYGEAIKDFWQRTIQPMQKRLAAELATQYLPHFGLDTAKYRLAWDYSDVEALQESEDAEWARISTAVGGAAWLSIQEARTKAGYDEPMEQPAESEPAEPEPDEDESDDEAATKAWDESKHPRADNGEFGSGSSATDNAPQLSEKAQRAKAAHVMVDKEIQRYAEEHNEPKFAKAMGGVSFPDSEPIDIAVPDAKGVVAHGIELKTIVKNSNGKITMKGAAMARKADWEQRNKATVHTVVFDDTKVFNANGPGKHDESKRVMYYRRGYGSFRIASCHEVKDLNELKTLMNTPNDKLPKAAQSKLK